jgi:hypothetical protein
LRGASGAEFGGAVHHEQTQRPRRGRVGRSSSTVTAIEKLDEFGALDPFFRIVEEGLSGLVDGDHFFDLLADGVVFDYVITVPGYPRRVVGRSAVAQLYRPYGETFVLHRCSDLAVHHDRESGVVVLE